MSYFQAIILAVIQALTEFLPISSSGHLVIVQKIFGFSEPPVVFDVLVHLGTLGALAVFLEGRLVQIMKGLTQRDGESWRIILMVIVGTIPTVIVGLFLQRYIGRIFNSLPLVGFSLVITAGLLFSARWADKNFTRPRPSRDEVGKGSENLRDLSWFDALFVGLFQALAILPGVSRSGSTIVSGLWRKLDREAAFHFSFYLAIPAIIGAAVLQLPALIAGQFSYLNQALLGMLVAGIAGYFSLAALKRILLGRKLWLFGIYCLSVGLLLLLFPGSLLR